MSDQPTSERPVRSQNVISGRARPRSLPAQISAALLRPVYFFRTLTPVGETRQWLWVGLLICLLVGYSAVRYQALVPSAADTDTPPVDFGGGIPGDITGDLGGKGIIDGGSVDGGITGDFGGLPPDNGGTTTDTTANTTDSVTTGILAASGVVFGWGILTVLFSLASLFSGHAPRWGHNFQIAVWASLPIALMTAFQLVYWLSGGSVRQPGISGFLLEQGDLATFPSPLHSIVTTWRGMGEGQPFLQAVLLLFASNLTIFWIWGLMMLYFGARFALNGRRWSAGLVVVMWIMISLTLPVATGAVEVPEFAIPLPDEFGMPTDGIPMDGMPSDGFPSDQGGNFSSGDSSTDGGFNSDGTSPEIIIVTEEASVTDGNTNTDTSLEPIETLEIDPDKLNSTPEVSK